MLSPVQPFHGGCVPYEITGKHNTLALIEKVHKRQKKQRKRKKLNAGNAGNWTFGIDK